MAGRKGVVEVVMEAKVILKGMRYSELEVYNISTTTKIAA